MDRHTLARKLHHLPDWEVGQISHSPSVSPRHPNFPRSQEIALIDKVFRKEGEVALARDRGEEEKYERL